MPKPNVKVRLSAEGQEKVVQSLKKVGRQADKTAKKSKKAFGGMNKVLGASKGLFAGLGLALGGAALIGFAKAGAEAAGQMGELSQATGVSTEKLSAIRLIATRMGVDFNKAAGSIGKTAKQVADLRGGSGVAVRAFRALRLEAADFEGKDTAEQFELVAQKMALLEDGADKTAIAYALYGKQALGLIPIMNQLGTEGFASVEARAEALGVLFSQDVADATDAVLDDFQFLTLQAQGLGAQFVTGLAPDAIQTMAAISDALGGGSEAWRQFGRVVGFIIKVLAGTVIPVLDGLVTGIIGIWTALAAGTKGSLAFIRGDFEEANEIWAKGNDDLEQQGKDFAERQVKLFKSLTAPTPEVPEAPKRAAADASGLYQDRARAQQAALKAELRLFKLNQAAMLTEERRALDQGLQTLERYYADRADLINAGIDKEIDILQRQLVVQEGSSERATADVEEARLRGAIAELEIKRTQQIIGLEDEKLTAVRKLNQERLKFEDEMLAAQGKGHLVTLRQIQERGDKYAETLARDGQLSAEQQTLAVARFRETLTAGAEFEQRLGQFNLALTQLNTKRAEIQADVERGLVTAQDAELAILALEQERAAQLEEILALTLAAAQASGDPEKIAQARELALATRNLGTAAKEAEGSLKNMATVVGEQVQPELANFLVDGIDNAENFGDAVAQMADGVIQSLRRMLAQYLATKAVTALGLGGFADGGLVGAATGGLIAGRGGPTSDSNIIRVSRGEFMVKAAVVRQPGVLEGLRRLNAGAKSYAAALPTAGIRGYAEGGLVEPEAGTQEVGGEITVGLEDGLIERALESARGQKVIIRAVTKNRRQIKRALG